MEYIKEDVRQRQKVSTQVRKLGFERRPFEEPKFDLFYYYGSTAVSISTLSVMKLKGHFWVISIVKFDQ